MTCVVHFAFALQFHIYIDILLGTFISTQMTKLNLDRSKSPELFKVINTNLNFVLISKFFKNFSDFRHGKSFNEIKTKQSG